MSSRCLFLIWCAIVVLATSAGFLTRWCGDIPAASIGFWRVAGAALVWLPFGWIEWRRSDRPRLLTRGAVISGTFLGVHLASWSWALQNTTLSNAYLFMGLQPLLAPFVARPVLGERLNRGELAACLMASAGMAVILGGQFAMEPEHLAGSLVAFGSAVMCASFFVFTRKYRARQSSILFTLAVFATAAFVQGALALALDGQISAGQGAERFALLGLILFPTVGGHSLSIYLLRYVKSQLVALAVPAQFALATVGAIWFFDERMTPWLLGGAALVMAGVILGVMKSEPQSSVSAVANRES
ncbi:MAG: DMT family transporter [Kiritimatiellae bacterium]|nr:DMT family transporter [Kiritimatiellia bacterium]MDW8459454.1 DMT family transporter [Verrucomicrobiota bacterium]